MAFSHSACAAAVASQCWTLFKSALILISKSLLTQGTRRHQKPAGLLGRSSPTRECSAPPGPLPTLTCASVMVLHALSCSICASSSELQVASMLRGRSPRA